MRVTVYHLDGTHQTFLFVNGKKLVLGSQYDAVMNEGFWSFLSHQIDDEIEMTHVDVPLTPSEADEQALYERDPERWTVIKTKEKFYNDWLSEVDQVVQHKGGVSLYELPDTDLTSMYSDGLEPEEAAVYALKQAGFPKELLE